jgi:ribonuclease J
MENAKVKLTFFGGMGEVGGNMVFLEDLGYDVRIFLDFGMNMKFFLREYPRNNGPLSVPEIIEKHLLPDFMEFGLNNITLPISKSQKINEPNPPIDGVFISHPHKDHFYGLPYLNRKIPVYSGLVTKKIMLALSATEAPAYHNKIDDLNWNTFRSGEVIKIKNLCIVPVHVDHSVPAAYGFIVYTSVGPIVYSGDFRYHGPMAKMTEDLLLEATIHGKFRNYWQTNSSPPGIKDLDTYLQQTRLLICEGTKINKGTVESEEFVEQNLDSIFTGTPFEYFLVKYERTDWDRFRTFANLAKKNEWNYILGERDAYYYYLFNKDENHETMRHPNIEDDQHLLILKWGDANFPWQIELRQALYKKGQSKRLIDYADVPKLPTKFLMYITHLHDELRQLLETGLGNKRGMFISSSVDPYSELMYDNTEEISNKMIRFGIPTLKVHASGHANSADIINFIEHIDPAILVPIHTDNPDFFGKLFKNGKIEVKNLHNGQTLEIVNE